MHCILNVKLLHRVSCSLVDGIIFVIIVGNHVAYYRTRRTECEYSPGERKISLSRAVDLCGQFLLSLPAAVSVRLWATAVYVMSEPKRSEKRYGPYKIMTGHLNFSQYLNVIRIHKTMISLFFFLPRV
jgi:hypothetical protein